GPGIDLLDRQALAAVAPAIALAIGWIGAAFGACFEWRYLRRIPRGAWLLAAISSLVTLTAVALATWLAMRLIPALSASWALPRTELGFAVLATLLLGAGVGTAAGVPPFVTCFLASALIVNASPQRHAVRAVLVEGERPSYAVLLVVTGALLALPTAWILVAAPVLLGLRAVAKWAAVRFGGRLLGLARGSRERGGLGTIAQGGVVVALGLSYALLYGGAGPLLTTIVLLVAAAQLSAVPLWTFALRADSAGPVAPATPDASAPLTQTTAPPELSANVSAEWPR